jgi:hypothetical protein
MELDYFARKDHLRPDLERIRFPFPLDRCNFPQSFNGFSFTAIGRMNAAPAPSR